MADQGTAERLVEVAKAEVGVVEGPKDNETKYGKFTKSDFQPWCGSFVMWCANEAGVKVPNTVYTPNGAAAFKKKGAWIDGDVADPEPGDIAYFDFPSDGVDRISHVGIVIKDNEDGTVWCIEGNTSSKKAGEERSRSSTENSCPPAYFLTDTERNSEVIPVSSIVASSASSPTVGTAVSLGISKDIPASGNTPRLTESTAGLSAFARGLITSVSWRTGTRPLLLEVVSSAART